MPDQRRNGQPIADVWGINLVEGAGVKIAGALDTQENKVDWTISSGTTERTTVPFTIYVDHVNGSDSNDGKSPGTAVKTITRALLLGRQLPQRLEVCFVEGGQIDVTAPIHVSYGVVFRSFARGAVVINRNFGTPNGRSVWDGVTTAAGTTINSATAAFAVGDVNRIICVYGAGFGGGTFYDFIVSRTDASNVVTTAATTIARNATTDPKGVKLSVVGDWNRVVTDAAMTSGSSILTSPTANFTDADINTEVVVAGAGQAGQALRSVVISRQSATQVTLLGVSSATISSKRCAIGVVFGDLFVFHAGVSGMRNLNIQDQSTGQNRIGSAIKIMATDLGASVQSSPSDIIIEYPLITSVDTAGAWEHNIDIDGSWNQGAGGPGCRRWTFVAPEFFGTRRPTENVRIVSGVHGRFLGGNIEASAPLSPAIAQGIVLLDPQKTGGAAGYSISDINFACCEGFGSYFYCEGQYVNYDGGRLGPNVAVAGRVSIELGPTSDHCTVETSNCSTTNAGEIDSGTNNKIETQSSLIQTINGGLNGLSGTATLRLQGGTAGANFQAIALTTGTVRLQTVNNADIDVMPNSVTRQRFSKTGSFIAQVNGALSTSATDGFLYLPTCAGTPTGVPTTVTGASACVYDTTANKLWVYNGSWRGVVLA